MLGAVDIKRMRKRKKGKGKAQMTTLKVYDGKNISYNSWTMQSSKLRMSKPLSLTSPSVYMWMTRRGLEEYSLLAPTCYIQTSVFIFFFKFRSHFCLKNTVYRFFYSPSPTRIQLLRNAIRLHHPPPSPLWGGWVGGWNSKLSSVKGPTRKLFPIKKWCLYVAVDINGQSTSAFAHGNKY